MAFPVVPPSGRREARVPPHSLSARFDARTAASRAGSARRDFASAVVWRVRARVRHPARRKMKGPWFWFWRKNFQATDRRLESADPRSQLFFGPQDIFPRLRFGKDVHTPGTPAFDSVSPSAGLFRELIPAISFFIFHRLRVGVRPESLALERRVHANVHRHADRHPGRAELARV